MLSLSLAPVGLPYLALSSLGYGFSDLQGMELKFVTLTSVRSCAFFTNDSIFLFLFVSYRANTKFSENGTNSFGTLVKYAR